MVKLWAVRGATTVLKDDPAAVVGATEELLLKLLQINGINATDIVSIIFTVTHDIQSEFPAVAARKIGLVDTPLICTQEIPKPGSLPLCIRILMHFYTELAKEEVKSVYLHDAINLRPDLTSSV
ncbi:MAG TPA: chorismate mutase [Firmicutes bacterium]|jgi:chorismate mutase|nr:chorismate mutase [Bacillota bacterium]